MPTFSHTEQGANGRAHSWLHVKAFIDAVKTFLNTTKINYANVQTNGIRPANVRTYANVEIGRIRVWNDTGGAISANDQLYFSGTYDDGTDTIVTVAKAISTAVASTTFYSEAVADAGIADGAEGTAVLVKEIRGLDTSAATYLGQKVYLSTTGGEYTLTKPTGGDAVQVVGRVSKIDAAAGAIVFAPALGENPIVADGDGIASMTQAFQLNNTLTVGEDDTGYDVKFFGATSGKYWLWDESADKMIVVGDASVSGTATLATVNIGGGNIDGTAVGAGTPTTGAFTDVTADSATITALSATTAAVSGAATVGYESAVVVDTSVDGDINAKKIIPFDLTKSWCLFYSEFAGDPDTLKSYHKFRAQSIHTSWYQELGEFPPFGWIAINNAKDEVNIYDGRDGSAWMVFTLHAQNVFYGTANSASVAFKDGILYEGSGSGFSYADFLEDGGATILSGGKYIYGGDLSERNSGKISALYSSSPAIVNNAVNAVAAIRDPMGARDSFGRFKHRVAVGTDGGWSVSDAGIENFYDATATTDIVAAAFLSDGSLLGADESATRESLTWKQAVQTLAADAWATTETWINTGSGAEDLPFADGATFDAVAAIPGASIVDKSSPVAMLGTSVGMAIAHANTGDNTNGLTTIIDNVAHWPPYSGSGTKMRSWALESVAELFGNDLTNNNAVTFARDGVFDNCADFVAASSMSLEEADGADYTFTQALSVGCWFIRDLDSGGIEGLMAKWDVGVAGDRTFFLYVDGADDRVKGYMVSSGTGAVLSVSPAISLATWYRVDFTFDGANQRLYLNGELVDTDAHADTLIDSAEPFFIGVGGSQAGTPEAGTYFDGGIDNPYVMDRVLSADEIRREYHKGLRAMQSDVSQQHFDNADVDYVRVSPTGAYRIVGDESKAYILDDHDIIIATDGPPDSDSIQDAAIWEVPGGYSYVLGASSSIESVQTNPNILEGMR